MTDRYAGKPFLRLLDSYVLDCIGQLGDEQAEALRRMEPKLTKVYKTTGSWQQIIAAQMDFSPDLPERIRIIWENGSAKATEQGLSVDPREFTRQFVDTNFPH